MTTVSQPSALAGAAGDEGEPPSSTYNSGEPGDDPPPRSRRLGSAPSQRQSSAEDVDAEKSEAVPPRDDDRGAVCVDLVDATGRLSPAETERLCGLAERAAAITLARAARAAREIGPRLTPPMGGPGEDGSQLRVRVVDDAEMAAAHERHMNAPGTTDVIPFDAADGAAARGEPLDADVLVCLDEARRQAERRRTEYVHELLLYVVHALLHCLGHDDRDDAAFARMHAEEDRILTELGVGAVFDASRDGGAA